MKKGTKKIKYNGKALSKFDVAYLIDQCDVHAHAIILMDVMTYAELVHRLFDVCTCDMCGAIDWFDYLDEQQDVEQQDVEQQDVERYAVSKYGVLYVRDFERGEIRTLSERDITELGYKDTSRYAAACATLLAAFGKAHATIAAESDHAPKSRRAINAERVSEGLMRRYGDLIRGTMLGYVDLIIDYLDEQQDVE